MTDLPPPYLFTDPDLNTLTVEARAFGGHIRLNTHDPASEQDVAITVQGKDLDQLATEMYNAMGRDVIILDRPDTEDLLKWWVDNGRVCANHPRDQEYMTSAEARAHAANYAAAADLADAQAALMPDPAEVEALARVLLTYDVDERKRNPNLPQITDGTCKNRARAILAAGYHRESQ